MHTLTKFLIDSGSALSPGSASGNQRSCGEPVWKLHIGEIPRLDLCAIAVWGVSLGVLATHRAESRRRATEGEVLASVLTLRGAAAGFLPGPPSSMDGPVMVWVFQKAFQAGLRVAEDSIDALRETSPHHSSLHPTTLQLTLQPLLSPAPKADKLRSAAHTHPPQLDLHHPAPPLARCFRRLLVHWFASPHSRSFRVVVFFYLTGAEIKGQARATETI